MGEVQGFWTPPTQYRAPYGVIVTVRQRVRPHPITGKLWALEEEVTLASASPEALRHIPRRRR